MLFYTARIALLKGNFAYVSSREQVHHGEKLSLVEKQQSVNPLLLSAGAGEVPGVHRSPGGVASDPPPVLLGTDVGLLLRIKMGGGVPLCGPALQREQMVTGDVFSGSDLLLKVVQYQ